MSFIGKIAKGLRVDHRKHSADSATKMMPTPKTVEIPLLQVIDSSCECLVKAGDRVKVGTKIGDNPGRFGVPIHSSVSGTVKSVGDYLTAAGTMAKSVIIESNGLDEIDESVKPPVIGSKEEFLQAVRNSGLVGLGGAGFPTHAKLAIGDRKAEFLLINAAECEPYITSDYREIMEDFDTVLKGIELVKQYIDPEKILFCIEDNKPDAVALIREKTKDSLFQLKVMKSRYPQGAEKVLIYNATGRTVPEGKLPIDAGVIVLNVNTVAFIAEYVKTGMPLVKRRITVDGGAIETPANIEAPLGTRIKDLVEFSGGYREHPAKIIMGGPMMGIAVADDNAPVIKNNNAILAFTAKEIALGEETACIRCGKCVEACPYHLMPTNLDAASRTGDTDELKKLKVNLCMECGSCSYVCPAKRHLVTTIKLGKQLVRNSGK